jgi:hypothetical protein
MGPENLEGLLVILHRIMFVQLAQGLFVDFFKTDEDLPESGFSQERDDFGVTYDGVAPGLKS